jgi:methylated-DNA-[protein]-cysteine S-methyltransferase
MSHRFLLDRLPSPIGTLLVVTDEDGRLRALEFDDHDARLMTLLRRHYDDKFTLTQERAPAHVAGALRSYFAGRLDAVAQLPVATGGTPFQRLVWSALRLIPAGQTVSYGELASSIGRPGASRAVGLANRANPIGIVVPCHRVIGANGKLTGYAGGLERKQWLLDHERKSSAQSGRRNVLIASRKASPKSAAFLAPTP